MVDPLRVLIETWPTMVDSQSTMADHGSTTVVHSADRGEHQFGMADRWSTVVQDGGLRHVICRGPIVYSRETVVVPRKSAVDT